MSLFPEIDENKTRERVRELLGDYMSMKRHVSFDDSVYDLTQAIQFPLFKQQRRQHWINL